MEKYFHLVEDTLAEICRRIKYINRPETNRRTEMTNRRRSLLKNSLVVKIEKNCFQDAKNK